MAILNVARKFFQRSALRPGRRPKTALTLEVLESRVCLSLLISSNRTSEVLSYDEQTGDYQGVFASGGGLVHPGGLAIGSDGNLYVASNGTDNVLRFDGASGKFIDVFTKGGDLSKPSGIVFGPDGNLYVSSHSNDSVQRFDGQTGEYIDSFVASGSGGLSGPSEGLNFGPDGNLYVNSTGTNDVRRFDGQTGKFIDVFTKGGDLMHPSYLLFGPDGNLYVGSHIISRIMRYDGTTGAFIDAFVPESSGGLRNPTVFQFGPDGILYVNSRGSQNVLRFDGATGDFINIFIPSGGELNAPSGMLFTGGAGPRQPAGQFRAHAVAIGQSRNLIDAGEFAVLDKFSFFSASNLVPEQSAEPRAPFSYVGMSPVLRPEPGQQLSSRQLGETHCSDPVEPMSSTIIRDLLFASSPELYE